MVLLRPLVSEIGGNILYIILVLRLVADPGLDSHLHTYCLPQYKNYFFLNHRRMLATSAYA